MSIEIKQISYTYAAGTAQAVTALDNITFSVQDGEFVGIMGHTGCGKSTLLQLICGLMTPDNGQILLDGQDIHAKGYQRKILRQNIGVVFQYPEYQLFETTVEKDVAFALKYSGLSKAEVNIRVKEALERMGFSYEKIRRESPLALSGGEKRRVAIAGVLAAKPKILIFDEPIAGLDPDSRQNFLKMVQKLNQEGVTILMISHHTDSLCEYADRILVLSHGNLVMDGSPKEVFRDIALAEKWAIGASQTRKIAEMLNQRDVLVSADITKYKELLDVLKNILKGGGSS